MDNKAHTVLKGKLISISTSDSEDFYKLGIRNSQLVDARFEIAKYLLSCGCTLVYGGDLRRGGFTETLIDLVESHSSPDGNTDQPDLVSYLGWPADHSLSEDQEARLSKKVKFAKPGLPADVNKTCSPQHYINPTTPSKNYVRARAMTHMRETMNDVCDARIVLGGRVSGYKGMYPGVVEETYLSMQSKIPTYIVGSFGGAAFDIADLLTGNTGTRLSNEYQFMNSTLYENALYFNTQQSVKIDYSALAAYFNLRGISGLRNELTIEENKMLFHTADTREIILLITKGLIKKFSS